MQINDYIITKDGRIGKIKDIVNQNDINYIFTDLELGSLFDEDIIKSSPKIMDLIHVGDYVNGCPVLHKENNELICGLLLRYKEENIQNVVTKEQFESMEYKIGD